jgi:hypothetical protein
LGVHTMTHIQDHDRHAARAKEADVSRPLRRSLAVSRYFITSRKANRPDALRRVDPDARRSARAEARGRQLRARRRQAAVGS